MNSSFTFFIPTRLIFGAGRLKELVRTQYLPGMKALVVIGANGAMHRYGYLDIVISHLEAKGVDSVVYDRIQPNPLSRHVDEGAKVARDNGCDFVLGLGGGSTIDSAKSIAVMATNSGQYWEYIVGGSGGKKIPLHRALPIVAIPTTAGTGTEVDPWTVITNSDSHEKIGWGRDDTYPVLAIVDPELMLSVPPKTTAYTGMDAFFHAVEAYLSKVNQPASDLLALEAINLISHYLPRAVEDSHDLEARTKLAWASTAAGFCESLSSCISQHSLEHAISAFYPEVPHGAGLTMLSLAYFSFLAGHSPERFPAMARAMGEDVENLNDYSKATLFINALERLIAKVGLDTEKMSDYGIVPEDFENLAHNAFDTMGGLFRVTPVKMSEDDVIRIFKAAYE
ncbi:MAG: iron-containing alcohol dehydrogenase [Deltaproteobacteria bacterium]|nr:iron-containing alcohol dehydrogenase [Deltaproteobacteria bacterium]